MAVTNHERVGKGLELLRAGLEPFVERELKRAVHAGDVDEYRLRQILSDPGRRGRSSEADVQVLLRVMWDTWNEVFREILGHAERSLVSELRDHRNNWAHQQPFSSDDAYRALDSVHRLLTSVSAPQVREVDALKHELLRIRFQEQVRDERRRTARSASAVGAVAGLKPWREVVTPHQDVASGQYQQAEFAADLWQIYLNEGTDEYRDPVEFFRRTFLTDSLRRLLTGAVQRLSGSGGDPVVQLQTNFGGGKTHSMLALYHLFSGVRASGLAGIDEVLKGAGTSALPSVRRVVLVGNRISPGNPITKSDGTVVRTLWGELAWQLGGAEAFARVAADDERATSPGDRLRELLVDHGPCLVLIDEWVAYARQLHDESDLPAGSFETQFTFAQTLTESAKSAGNCMLVISLPASDIDGSPHTQADDAEGGGHRGREALTRLRNVIGGVEAAWRPATAEESFEIVRRRLFQPFQGADQFKTRDVVARGFSELYRSQQQEFPSECREADYEQRLKAAYPIHPEIFDRLYTDWSALAKFQRTRGVLRLMASVIHHQWEQGNRSPLILPGDLALDDGRVQSELTRYLDDNWAPIIERDVDGADSLPRRTDAAQPNLGKFSASRRVARAIFLGSAPTTGAAHRGIEDRRVKLGCVMPGESPAVFGDALRRLATAATYLYEDSARYWYATQPTVTKLAEDRAEQMRRNRDRIEQEIGQRMRADLRQFGDFSRVHAWPHSGHDVPDDPDARLVVLEIKHAYGRGGESAAEQQALAILESRGTTPRIYRNALVFLAADTTRLQELDEAVRRFLAWESIVAEREQLNLAPQQVRQAETRRDTASAEAASRIPETYRWLLVPTQNTPQDSVTWDALNVTGTEPLAVRAARKLKGQEGLVTVYASTLLRMELDRVPLWRGDHVAISQLVEDYARYPYLPRLKDPEVLLGSIRDGVSILTWEHDTFAYAESFDEEAKRYRGLRPGQGIELRDANAPGVLVKPAVARKQLDEEVKPTPNGDDKPTPDPDGTGGDAPGPDPPPPPPPPLRVPKRFHGAVPLDVGRVALDASQIANEVIAHMDGLVGAKVTVTLEIEAERPDGFPDHVVRTVNENSSTLKFSDHGFEHE
ncbi:MAG: Swt1 family HEPN domain-containing protein [Spirochaetaceae bacterium]|nr:Swt1 family HEPN domain-containing protein [Spirochaetaceae bacterium]